MSETKKKCETCDHLLVKGKETLCTRLPPTTHLVPVQGIAGVQITIQTVITPVPLEHKCGEWEPKPTPFN